MREGLKCNVSGFWKASQIKYKLELSWPKLSQVLAVTVPSKSVF